MRLLAVSGELDTTMGGRPVELTKEPYSLRRSVYGYIDRQDLPGLFRVFDLASPDSELPATSAHNRATTVPVPDELPFVMERAKHIAARPEVTSASTVADRDQRPVHLVFARDASPEEAADLPGLSSQPGEETSTGSVVRGTSHLASNWPTFC